MSLTSYLTAKLEKEYHNLSLWYFISFIFGIVNYFSLPFEPSVRLITSIFAGSLACLYLHKFGLLWRFFAFIIIAFASGMVISKWRALHIQTIGIEKTITSSIEGEIESIKPTVRGFQVTLGDLKFNEELKRVPQKVRISAADNQAKNLLVGDRVVVLAKLFKPQSSILPGGYDFGFYSYFSGIGATGYALSDLVLINQKVNSGIKLSLHKLRKIIYNRLLYVLGDEKGNFAAAILLGETKGIKKSVIQDMRYSGISHILCVSGLHLSLVAMICFMIVRFLLNLSDKIAYNYNIKRIAAIFALLASFCYLALTSMQIAATRAFIMTAIFIYAVIIERSPYPLRSIAIAAAIILFLNPEYVFHPSFQLSFIAVLSLISGYEFYLKNQWILGESKGIFSLLKFYLASNIYSSLIASIATAPLVINHFYIFSNYSILMNLLAVPIMSFLLMPTLILALVLMPIGMDYVVLKLVGFFINVLTTSASWVAMQPNSVWYFGYITSFSLVIFLLGLFWLCLWQTKWRLWGIGIILVSFILMLKSPKPDLIFDYQLKAIGLKNNEGKLEIYAAKIPNFTKNYWANWFGQKEATLYRSINNEQNMELKSNSGKIFKVYFKEFLCDKVDVSLNLVNNLTCYYNNLQLSKQLLESKGVVSIFCSNSNCRVQYESNRRFSFK